MIASLTVKVVSLLEKNASLSHQINWSITAPFPVCAQVGSSHLSLSNVDLICTYVFTNNQCSILTNTGSCNNTHRQRGGKERKKERSKRYSWECH